MTPGSAPRVVGNEVATVTRLDHAKHESQLNRGLRCLQ
jgi:hypothetical protein